MKNWLGISGFDNLIPPKYMVMKQHLFYVSKQNTFFLSALRISLLSYLHLEHQ